MIRPGSVPGRRHWHCNGRAFVDPKNALQRPPWKPVASSQVGHRPQLKLEQGQAFDSSYDYFNSFRHSSSIRDALRFVDRGSHTGSFPRRLQHDHRSLHHRHRHVHQLHDISRCLRGRNGIDG